MYEVATLLLSYLIGSINGSIIVGNILKKDIRMTGSKNAGLTNSIRVLGIGPSIFVLFIDILKAILACFIGYIFYTLNIDSSTTLKTYLILSGVGIIIGHNWPIYFKFKGGKGALSALTALFIIHWPSALICAIVFLLIIFSTGYISLGSIIGCLTCLFLSLTLFNNQGLYFQLFCMGMSLIIIFKHRSNIKRLILREEKRIIYKKLKNKS